MYVDVFVNLFIDKQNNIPKKSYYISLKGLFCSDFQNVSTTQRRVLDVYDKNYVFVKSLVTNNVLYYHGSKSNTPFFFREKHTIYICQQKIVLFIIYFLIQPNSFVKEKKNTTSFISIFSNHDIGTKYLSILSIINFRTNNFWWSSSSQMYFLFIRFKYETYSKNMNSIFKYFYFFSFKIFHFISPIFFKVAWIFSKQKLCRVFYNFK